MNTASQKACTPTSPAPTRSFGAEAVRDALRRAVGEEVRSCDDDRQDRDRDGDAAQRFLAEPSDDGGVDEAVQRFRGERTERRNRERDDAPVDR